ncbi:MAG: hypothetical protein MZV65_34180 [Chromatiales bacterium]|nr:hypothetical protein [Chromatiales bacterium]
MEQPVTKSRHGRMRVAALAAVAVALPVQAGELAYAYADASGKQLLAPREPDRRAARPAGAVPG